MKKTLLIASLIFSFGAISQDGIDIHYDGNEVSGTTVMVDIDPDAVSGEWDYWTGHFYVSNTTGSDIPVIITRKRVDVPASWTDYVCWPPTCYTTNEADEYYSTPSSVNTLLINNEDSVYIASEDTKYIADIKPQIYPDITTHSGATIRYYVESISTGEYLDSVTVEFAYRLNVNELSEVKMQIAPNPANDFVTINTDAASGSTVKVINLLGSVVYNETIENGQKINVSDLKNGVYFVTISGEGIKTTTQKMVIKH